MNTADAIYKDLWNITWQSTEVACGQGKEKVKKVLWEVFYLGVSSAGTETCHEKQREGTLHKNRHPERLRRNPGEVKQTLPACLIKKQVVQGERCIQRVNLVFFWKLKFVLCLYLSQEKPKNKEKDICGFVFSGRYQDRECTLQNTVTDPGTRPATRCTDIYAP